MQASVREQAGLEEVVVYGTVTETRQTFAAASGVIRFRPERFLKGRLPESGAWQTDARSGSHVGPPTSDETAVFGAGLAAQPSVPRDNTLLALGAVGIAVLVLAAAWLVGARGRGSILVAQQFHGRPS